MRHLNLMTMAAAMLAPALAPAAAPAGAKLPDSPLRQQADAYRHRALNHVQVPFADFSAPASKAARKGAPAAAASGFENPEPVQSFLGVDDYSLLLAPDGNMYYYTADLDYEYIEHEYWTEEILRSFTYHFYDNNFNHLGDVHDDVRYQEGEVRVVSAQPSVNLTQKFFNYDDRLEVILTHIINTDTGEGNRTKSLVYSIDGATDENGNTELIAEIPGLPVDAVNAAVDRWSENYYITFATEKYLLDIDDTSDMIEWLESYVLHLETYKKGGYAGGPQLVNERDIPVLHMPGDMESTPCLMSFAKEGRAYFIFQQYEKRFLEDPAGFTQNDDAVPDNHLLLDLYSIGGWESQFRDEQHTSIETVQSDQEGILWTFYSVGDLDWYDDLVWNGSEYDFVLSTQKYSIASDSETIDSYYYYTADGLRHHDIITDTGGAIRMSDIPGHERQFIFVNMGENPTFDFINVPSGEFVNAFDFVFGDDHLLTASIDRVADGDGGYVYAFRDGRVRDDGAGGNIESVVWIDTDGNILRVDANNTGLDTALAQPYITQAVLSPYYYDTDDEQEYMYLVKRFVGGYDSSLNQEELMIVSPSGKKSLHLTPDGVRGAMRSIMPLTNGADTKLQISWLNSDTKKYSMDFYQLPFGLFNEGEGTVDNPYRISSIGDLQQAGRHLNAHYVLTRDINAAGQEFIPIEGTFTGSLDGAGHTISNLSMTCPDGYNGIFTYMGQGAEVRDLSFVNATVRLDGSTSVGLLCGMAQGATVDNVHVMGLNVSGTGDFGSLVGAASLSTKVTDCSVGSARIDLPASSVGGLVASARTGVMIDRCAFTGTVTGGAEVGGIVGTTASGDEVVTDCHVNADLTAMHTVGGIYGYAKRSRAANCFVEGSIATTGEPGARRDFGPCAGGVIGYLTPYFPRTDADGNPVEPHEVAENCVVALSSMTGHEPMTAEEFNHQFDTMHRIVGKSSRNEMPEIIDWDENGNPVFGSNLATESHLSNNYAVATLPRTGSIQDSPKTTEGQSVDAADMTEDWFKTQAYAFGDKAWRPGTAPAPVLWHEAAAMLASSDITVIEGYDFTVRVAFNSVSPLSRDEVAARLADVAVDNDEVVSWTGSFSTNGTVAVLEFSALTEGEATVTVCGMPVRVTVLENPTLGVDSAVAENLSPLALRDGVLSAPGCVIEVYTLDGLRAARGASRLDIRALGAGVYTAVATADDGSRSTLKISNK